MRRRLEPPPVPPPFPAAFRTLLAELLARGARFAAERIEHRARRRAQFGQSGTFAGHRPYVRGDDPRRIDWAAYARSGELHVMQLEEDERRTATLLLDLSARLCVGDAPRRLFALRAAAIVGGLALRHLDGLEVHAPGAGAAAIASFAGIGDFERLLQHLAALPFAETSPRDAVGAVLQRGAFGRVHWVSDFADPAACEVPLAALRRRGGRAIGWLPEVAEDRVVPAAGYVQLADPGTGAVQVVTIDKALAAAMRAQLHALRTAQDRVFAQSGSSLVRWQVPAADDCRPASYVEIVSQCRR